MSQNTPDKTLHGNLFGEKLYQTRARQALPLLVRNAIAEQPIEYGALAEELGMPNARNLNYVLGVIGNAMINLGREWKIKVPAIQAIVVNKQTKIPGEGFADFAPLKARFKDASAVERRKIIDVMLGEIYGFNRWNEVLKHFGLHPAVLISDPGHRFSSKGESDEHKKLKLFVANHPELFGIPINLAPGIVEAEFGSSDTIDVLFKGPLEWVGIEVKSKNSSIDDIRRGLFQCVKYTALIQATLRVEQRKLNYRVILALGGKLPKKLISLRNILGVTVKDDVRV